MCTHLTLVSAHICLVQAYFHHQLDRKKHKRGIIGTELVLFSGGYLKPILDSYDQSYQQDHLSYLAQN